MTPEQIFNDSELEQAMSEVRDVAIDSAVVEAAAARVWARLAEAAEHRPAEHIRGCADFQALIPELKSGALTGARAVLLKDHLHECVACRRIYEGRVVELPAARPARRVNYNVRWAAAAVVLAAAGLSVWVAVDQYGGKTGRAIVQTVNGTLYEVSAAGIRPLAAGQDLPDGIEIRTAPESNAMLQLRDGSVVELRERSAFRTTQAAKDLTIHLGKGSIIVQAAKRRSGHLYVDTADYRVAVTGTIFGVTAGVKGSRVSVIEGEVHVTRDNNEKVLHPGDQSVSSDGLEPESVKEDIRWSRNRDKYFAILQQIRADIEQLHLPALRYSSTLIGRLPANTVFFAAIPNLAQYLGDAESVVQRKMAETPELRGMWGGNNGALARIVEQLRGAGEYLGDEVVIAGFAGSDGRMQGPIVLAQVKREGFPEYLKKAGLPIPLETRNGLVEFGPDAPSVAQFASVLDAPSGGFAGTPFYARIMDSYHDGAGLLICADLSKLPQSGGTPIPGARYFVAEQKEINHQSEARASLGFDGARTGVAAWLADPAPMGALDYVSPEATIVAAFIARDPGAIVDALAGVVKKTPADLGVEGFDLKGASLGGEFTFALDGPVIPVPSWKLVAEVYDAARFQATLQSVVDAVNRENVKNGGKALRTSQEVVDGRTYYMIAGGDPNPLTEAHYTYADGYFIAGPTRALVTRALQVKTSGTSILRSTKFVSMMPRDHYTNFSAVVYENLGTTLAPFIGLAGAFAPIGAGGQNALQGLANVKPSLIAAYGEPDSITIASNGNVLGAGITNLMTGNLGGIVGGLVPIPQFNGTPRQKVPYR